MHKAREILEEVVTVLKPLTVNGNSIIAERFKPDTVTKYPTVMVGLGGDVNNEDSFDQDLRELTIYTDIFVRSISKNIEDDALDVREVVEAAMMVTSNFTDPAIQMVRFSEQQEIEFNQQESDDYAVKLRLVWLITYVTSSTY